MRAFSSFALKLHVPNGNMKRRRSAEKIVNSFILNRRLNKKKEAVYEMCER